MSLLDFDHAKALILPSIAQHNYMTANIIYQNGVCYIIKDRLVYYARHYLSEVMNLMSVFFGIYLDIMLFFDD
jgi:hypothetical protein